MLASRLAARVLRTLTQATEAGDSNYTAAGSQFDSEGRHNRQGESGDQRKVKGNQQWKNIQTSKNFAAASKGYHAVTPSLFDDLPKLTDKGEPSVKRKMEEEEIAETSKRMSTDCLELKAYIGQKQGERDEMQDAHVIVNNFASLLPPQEASVSRLAFYGVFDGHNGTRASKYTSEHLHRHVADRFPKGDVVQIEKDIKKCFIDAFKKTDEEFLKAASKTKPRWKDGTTAVTVLALNDTLYIANLGDSKAILCRYNEASKTYCVLPLSKDHSPTLYEERMRIQKAGGTVREGRVMGTLEVSRSIGDGSYKNHGVICLPDVKRCQLTNNDRFLIIACDGLWKRFDNESAIEFVNQILDDKGMGIPSSKTEKEHKYEVACARLVNEAVRRLSADNVTVILVAVGKRI